jgi:hypothetical protein
MFAFVLGGIVPGDVVHCRVVLGSQQDRTIEGVRVSEYTIMSHVFILKCKFSALFHLRIVGR